METNNSKDMRSANKPHITAGTNDPSAWTNQEVKRVTN